MNEISKATFNLLALSGIERMGIGALFNLINKADLSLNLEEIAEYLNAAHQSLRLPCGIINDHDLDEGRYFAEREAETAIEHGIRIVSFLDADYPKVMRYNPYARPFISVKGPLPSENEKLISIVGGLLPTHHGITITRRISEFLISKGFTLCSTLAEGCNTEVHRTALDADVRSIVMLHHGHNFIYPRENSSLASAIIAAGGTIISPFSFYTESRPKFVASALRLLGAMSQGCVLIQAELHDMVLNTAHAALTCNHYLAVVSPTARDRQENTEAVSANLRLAQKGTYHCLPTVDLHNQRELGLNYERKIQLINSKEDYELLTGAQFAKSAKQEPAEPACDEKAEGPEED